MSGLIEIHIRAQNGVPIDLLAAIAKALDTARPEATLDGSCDCCNLRLTGDKP